MVVFNLDRLPFGGATPDFKEITPHIRLSSPTEEEAQTTVTE